MNAITLHVPISTVLAGYDLPEDAQLSKVRVEDGGKTMTVIVHSARISTPYDYPQDYDEWKAAEARTPIGRVVEDVLPKPQAPITNDQPGGEENPVPLSAGGPFATPPTGGMQTTRTASGRGRKPRL